MASANENRGAAGRLPSGGNHPSGLAALIPLIVPVVVHLLALILPSFMFQSNQSSSQIGFGPAFWPMVMLRILTILSAIWVGYEICALRRTACPALMTTPREDGEYDIGKALIGLVGIVAYGWLLPIIGFALATSLFIMLWCWFGNMRKPVVIVSVALIGTIALLWLFMGLALMPLPRGNGIFDGFSIFLLRITGIY